jgi:hypothetical protein
MKKADACSLSSAAQEQMRLQAIRMRQELTWAEIAKVVGVTETTASGWGKRFMTEGESGLVCRSGSACSNNLSEN